MAEGSKVLRHILLGSLHRVVVNRTDVQGPDGIALSSELMEAAGLIEFEKVDLFNASTGARLAAAVLPACSAFGEVMVSGAAGQFASTGEQLTVSAWGWMKEKAVDRHQPRLVRVDALNRPMVDPARAVPQEGGQFPRQARDKPGRKRPKKRISSR